jgi:hypothetical protein
MTRADTTKVIPGSGCLTLKTDCYLFYAETGGCAIDTAYLDITLGNRSSDERAQIRSSAGIALPARTIITAVGKAALVTLVPIPEDA